MKKTFILSVMAATCLLMVSCKKTDTPANTTTTTTTPITVTDIDGNVYHTVTIGTQVWMKENLKVTRYRNGNAIPNVTNDTAWSKLTTGAYCNYGNDTTNGNIYGRLYNWYAVRNIAPTGWHVPTDAEWATLVSYLDSSVGGKLKESGTSHWNSPNTGATNSSGFLGLPGGTRIDNGTFNDVGNYGYWWGSDEDNEVWYLYYRSSYLFGGFYKGYSFSVRCVKD